MTIDGNSQAIQIQVGLRIRELRKAADLSAAELARLSGLSQGQISKVETGKATLSIGLLSGICQALDRPLSYLFQKDTEIPRVLGTMTTVAGPENHALTWFSEEVAKRTAGRLSLVPLQATVLGSQAKQAILLKEGRLDLFIEDLPAFRELAPACDLFSLPYLFRDEGHRQSLLKSAAFERLVKGDLLKQGVRPLNIRWNWRRGLERVILATKPIVHPDQMRGLKVRVFESPFMVRFWEEMGAVPVVIPWPQVKKAWLGGEVDILPTNKTHLYPLEFCRRGRYITMLGDIPPLLIVAVNQDRYNSLPPAFQKTLLETCDTAGDIFTQEVVRAEVENERANMRQYGAVYLKVDIEPWQNAAMRITERLMSENHSANDLWNALHNNASST